MLLQRPPRREDYIIEHGLRYVVPYHFDFLASVKRRWEKRTVVDVFTAELIGRPRSYYEAAEAVGRRESMQCSLYRIP